MIESEYHVVRSRAYPPYQTLDSGTGRCRMSEPCLQKLSIKLGWVVSFEIRLDLKESEENITHGTATISVACTVWPDTHQELQENLICVDDTVRYTKPNHHENAWMSGVCKILEAYPPTICRNLRISYDYKKRKNGNIESVF